MCTARADCAQLFEVAPDGGTSNTMCVNPCHIARARFDARRCGDRHARGRSPNESAGRWPPAGHV